MERCASFLETDHIDHVTIHYRRGEGLDRGAAVRLLMRAMGCFPTVAEAMEDVPLNKSYLDSLPDDGLVSLLVRARTALLAEAWK
ncbi:MAG: hypothetical protein K6C36_08670 [Clostridia bacterium]|nr:hypothetical protein [Clostridia bacterium]